MSNPALLRDEDFQNDCREATLCDGVHPALRRLPRPKPNDQCTACRRRWNIEDLTEDGLCPECNEAVKKMEQGRIS